MAAVSSVRTIRLVARDLGVAEKELVEIAYPSMEPEHGLLWIYDLDGAALGFTPDGVDHLEELITDLRPDLLKE